jgi:release factor glutamine methyltransferase
MTDEGYRTLTRFVHEVGGRLADGGRVLMHFSDSGDLGYLHALVDAAGFRREVVATSRASRGELVSTYEVMRLT